MKINKTGYYCTIACSDFSVHTNDIYDHLVKYGQNVHICNNRESSRGPILIKSRSQEIRFEMAFQAAFGQTVVQTWDAEV